MFLMYCILRCLLILIEFYRKPHEKPIMWLLYKVFNHFRNEKNIQRNKSAPCEQKKQHSKKQISKQLKAKDPVTRKSANCNTCKEKV